jgi:glycosyltransferase involved in cell wall biosynthesis
VKLLITVGIFPPEIGGPATYVHSLAHWLKENNLLAVVATALREPLEEEYPFPIHVVRKKGKILWHIRAFFKLLKLMKSAELVYVNGLFFESFLAAFLRRKKIVCRIPGDIAWERAVRRKWTQENFFDFQEKKGNFQIRLLRNLRKYCLKRAAKIIAPSQFLAEVIEDWGIAEERIEVVYNPFSPVEPETFRLPQSSVGKFIVVTGGRLVPWKGIPAVIEIIKQIPKAFLVIVGQGPEEENLKKIVGHHLMEDQVFFTGGISKGQMIDLFSKSHCFVLNSLYEGLPHIILEALSVQCPVIATHVGGNPEVVSHFGNGLLYEPEDPESLKDYLEGLIFDEHMCKSMGSHGKETVKEKFDMHELFGRLVNIFLECE